MELNMKKFFFHKEVIVKRGNIAEYFFIILNHPYYKLDKQIKQISHRSKTFVILYDAYNKTIQVKRYNHYNNIQKYQYLQYLQERQREETR